jgi:hypothetical protein
MSRSTIHDMTRGPESTYDGRKVALAFIVPILVASPFLVWWFVLVVTSWSPGVRLGLLLCAAAVAVLTLAGRRARRQADRVEVHGP